MKCKSLIEIFRGDDSDALSYQTIVGTIHTDLDLSGCVAVFRYLNFFQEFDPIPEDGKLTVVIPAASSAQFPPGLGYASLKVYDIDKKIRTFTNRIPVFVSTVTPSRGCGEFHIEFSPFPELEPLRIFRGPNADDYDDYTGFVSEIIDRASLEAFGLAMLVDAMGEDGGETGKAASPLAVKGAYDAIIKELTDNYYTAQETDEAIDALAAYYVTSNAAGDPFPTHAALMSATKFYSGGVERIPTRNDYCVVLEDETHDDSEYRYIYAVSDEESGDEDVGVWQAQYPVGGTMALDASVTKSSPNPVTSSGIWSAIWGVLAALPTGFSSLYDWCVAQIAKLRDKLDLNVYGYGNASVSFPDGYSITYTYTGDTYTAPSGGESIEFYGPISSTAVPGYNFWVPYEYKDTTDFDPQAQTAWCLFGGSTPTTLMYRTGASYSIANWNTEAPTLTLSNGEATGDAPTMARPLGTTGDTLAKASQLAGKLDKSGDDFLLLGTRDYGISITEDGEIGIHDTDQGQQTLALLMLPRETGTVALAAPSVVSAGNLAALDSQGNPTDSLIPAANVALKGNIPYALVTKTISNNTVALDDRAINAVAVSSSLASLTVNFPTATSGKARDFGLRLTVASGITTAPELALPQGVTCENADGEAPEIGADGAATILYFTETASGVFLVKGEVVTAIS